jgi:hypothetical protein
MRINILALQGEVYEKWLFKFNVENIRILTTLTFFLSEIALATGA